MFDLQRNVDGTAMKIMLKAVGMQVGEEVYGLAFEVYLLRDAGLHPIL